MSYFKIKNIMTTFFKLAISLIAVFVINLCAMSQTTRNDIRIELNHSKPFKTLESNLDENSFYTYPNFIGSTQGAYIADSRQFTIGFSLSYARLINGQKYGIRTGFSNYNSTLNRDYSYAANPYSISGKTQSTKAQLIRFNSIFYTHEEKLKGKFNVSMSLELPLVIYGKKTEFFKYEKLTTLDSNKQKLWNESNEFKVTTGRGISTGFGITLGICYKASKKSRIGIDFSNFILKSIFNRPNIQKQNLTIQNMYDYTVSSTSTESIENTNTKSWDFSTLTPRIFYSFLF